MGFARLITLVIIVCAFALYFYRLGSRPLNSWDESVYAESAREMVQDGDWLTPHWNHQKFLQKPPLFIWSIALPFKLFGASEITARTTSALAGVGCVVMVLLIARLFVAEFTAVFAALMLLASPSFRLDSRYAITDVMLTFFMLAAIYAYLRTKENTRWWLVVGVVSGLAVMTKSAAVIPLFLAMLIVIIWKDRSTFRHRDVWFGLMVCFVTAGPWHLLMLGLHGRVFIADYFGLQIWNRALKLVDSPEGQYGMFSYVPIVLWGFFPAFVLLPFSIAGWVKSKKLPPIIPVFGVLVFVLYSLASTKHQWYVIPIFPILSIIAAPLSQKLLPLYVAAIAGGLIFSAGNRPDKNIAAIAELSKHASMDAGPVGYYPGLLHGPEILFYSKRSLCADAPEHSMGSLTKCALPQDVIMPSDEMANFPGAQELARSGKFVYCRLNR